MVSSNEKKPSIGAPIFSICPIHKKQLTHIGNRIVHKKIDGIWKELEEPIIECVDCIFPPE